MKVPLKSAEPHTIISFNKSNYGEREKFFDQICQLQIWVPHRVFQATHLLCSPRRDGKSSLLSAGHPNQQTWKSALVLNNNKRQTSSDIYRAYKLKLLIKIFSTLVEENNQHFLYILQQNFSENINVILNQVCLRKHQPNSHTRCLVINCHHSVILSVGC